MKEKGELFVDYFPFNPYVIEKMYNLRFLGMPLSFLLLDGRKTDTYCHFCANFLCLVVSGSVMKSGKMVKLDGEEHSWVEVDDYVFDSSTRKVYKKDAYYEDNGVFDTRETLADVCAENVEEFLSEPGCLELYVAWIMDLEGILDKNVYGKFLRNHIDRFKEELKLDDVVCDETKVTEQLLSLQNLYDEIDRFKRENSIKIKAKTNDC